MFSHLVRLCEQEVWRRAKYVFAGCGQQEVRRPYLAFLIFFTRFFCLSYAVFLVFLSFYTFLLVFCQFLCCSLSSPTGRVVHGCHPILIFRQTKPFLLLVCLFGTWRHRHWHLACQTCLNIGRIRTLELRAVEKTASCISFQLLAS